MPEPNVEFMFQTMEKQHEDMIREMRTGFVETHKRLDKTNGNVMANTKWRWGISFVISFIAVTLIPVLLMLVSYWIKGQN